MSCVEQKKYKREGSKRKAPPFSAGDCKGQTKKGLDGKMWVSHNTDRKAKSGHYIYRWIRVTSAAPKKKAAAPKKSVAPKKKTAAPKKSKVPKMTKAALSDKIKEEEKRLERRIKAVKNQKKKVDKEKNLLYAEEKKVEESEYLISQLNYIKDAKGDLLTIATAFKGNPFRTDGNMYRTDYYFNIKRDEMIIVRELDELEAWRCKLSRPCFQPSEAKNSYRLDYDIEFKTHDEVVKNLANLPIFKGLDLSNINIKNLPTVKAFLNYRGTIQEQYWNVARNMIGEFSNALGFKKVKGFDTLMYNFFK